MSDTTIVAVTILGGVFVVMSVAILKSGIDAAIRLWGVMGAITGVAFGAITSHYFTKQATTSEVAALSSEKARVELLLASATKEAAEARELVSPIYAALISEKPMASPSAKSLGYAWHLSSDERTMALATLEKATSKLDRIQFLDSAKGALPSATVASPAPAAAVNPAAAPSGSPKP